MPPEDAGRSEEMKTLQEQAKRKGAGHIWEEVVRVSLAVAVIAGVGRSWNTLVTAGTSVVAMASAGGRRSRVSPVAHAHALSVVLVARSSS